MVRVSETSDETSVEAAPHAIDEFDPTTPVAEGITVLEASAGTGKTHAVASLVVAEIARGRPLDELLVVTFTRKATGTLRERVWLRLNRTARGLAPGAGDPVDEHGTVDGLLVHLRQGDATQVAERRANLERALSDFDAATIATTHGFCQQVLAGLGVAGDAERDLELVEDVRDLVTDAVDDLFVRRFHQGDDVLFDRATAMAIARTVVDKPDCAIAPVDDNKVDRQRRAFAIAVRKRIVEQKRSGRLITYDDLLARLDNSIADGERGDIVAERLRRRFSMAVVDEFQDTDSVQWRILRKAFGGAPNRLVLVGDPKQAIYAFRGGDVFAYLAATDEADQRCGLTVSWRADQALLDALDALFEGARFGAPTIRHRQVRARPGAVPDRLQGPSVGAPLTVRIARRDSDAFALTPYGWAAKASVRRFIADDLAAEALRILTAGSTIDDEPVGPGHLAVLTRTNRQADAARDALHAVGIPAVVHGGASVLTTDAARDWLDLLQALEQPARETGVHTVAIGPFIGWDAARLATATDAEWERIDGFLHEWAVALRSHAVAGLLRRIEADTGLTARLLATIGGERQVSDLRHIAELLHGWQSAHQGSIAALSGWLAEQLAGVDDTGADTARRRLESDASAVAVHTVHGAKGLEFPIVLLPSLWDCPPRDKADLPVFHDENGDRAIGVGARGEVHGWQAAKAAEERDQEDLRLLYVALTRARHRVVAWWATPNDAGQSALARMLLGKDEATGDVDREIRPAPDEDTIAAALDERGITRQDATGRTDERYSPPRDHTDVLAVRTFDRRFDDHWVRTSYSGLTRAAHDSGPSVSLDIVEVGETSKVDEPEVAAPAAPTEGELAVPLPLVDVPGGARVGTLAHELLEHADFTAPDLVAELTGAADTAGAARVVGGQVDALVAGLAAALETPLGPHWGDARLRDLGHADRLDELTFDLPLAGGDRPRPELVTMDAIGDVFAALPPEDPLAGYHERLRDPLLANGVRGFLSGSIDLVARLGDRHVVIDYKTNHLAPLGETPTTWHYRPEALVEAMADAHYPLQAALYAVALHRFLRWRLADYDPTRHLGGVAYLFVRGMTGPDVPRVDGHPCGVFAWQPPATFVTALSDLLDRGAP